MKYNPLTMFNKIMRTSKCLYPTPANVPCRKTIKSHTIQKSSLNKIAVDGHVFRIYEPFDYNNPPKRIGTRKASTYSSFCTEHDNKAFSPLEKETWQPTKQQIGLLGYRAIAIEFMLKQNVVKMAKKLPHLFPTFDLDDLSLFAMGAQKSVQDMTPLKHKYDKMLLKRSFDDLSSYVIEIDSTPEIMCSGATQPTHDFQGNLIADLGDWQSQIGFTTCSIIATNRGGAIIFTWVNDSYALSERKIRTLDSLDHTQLPHAIIRHTFEFFENTFFSPKWWGELKKEEQGALIERFKHNLPPQRINPYDCLLDDGLRVVNWNIISKKLIIPEPPYLL